MDTLGSGFLGANNSALGISARPGMVGTVMKRAPFAVIVAGVIGVLAALVLGAKDKESAMELAKRQGQLSFMLVIST